MDQNNTNKEEIDLSGALEDSGTGIKFQDKLRRPAQSFYSETPKIIQWVIKYLGGLVKDEKQAMYVLLGFVMIALIISFFLIFEDNNEQKIFTPGAEAPVEQVVPPA